MREAVGTEPIVKELHIDASPETVFAFFTEPDKLTRWLAVEATLDARPGGVCHQTHQDHDGTRYEMRGEFVEVVPPSRVVFTWGFAGSAVPPGASTVEVTLRPDGDGTHLTFVHRDLPAERDDHDTGWDEVLGRLVTAVAGGDPDAR
jgi:uncharacterized protein YndB with AHSA1/START domain